MPQRFMFHVSAARWRRLPTDRLVRGDADAFHPSDEELRRVRELNALDDALYDLVRERFDDQIARTWGADTTAEYERYRAALARFRTSTGSDINAVSQYGGEATELA